MSTKIFLNGSWVDMVASTQAPDVINVSGSGGILTLARTQMRRVPWTLDASTATNLSSLFKSYTALEETPPVNAPVATTLANAYEGCTSLTAVGSIYAPNVTTTTYMFSGCSALTEVPLFDTSNVTTATYMFNGCASLIEVPPYDFTKAVTNSTTFAGMASMTSMLAFGMLQAFSVAQSALSASALNVMFSNLGTVSTARVVTITGTPGAATCDRSIATAKGWTVTG